MILLDNFNMKILKIANFLETTHIKNKKNLKTVKLICEKTNSSMQICFLNVINNNAIQILGRIIQKIMLTL